MCGLISIQTAVSNNRNKCHFHSKLFWCNINTLSLYSLQGCSDWVADGCKLFQWFCLATHAYGPGKNVVALCRYAGAQVVIYNFDYSDSAARNPLQASITYKPHWVCVSNGAACQPPSKTPFDVRGPFCIDIASICSHFFRCALPLGWMRWAGSFSII